MHEKLFSIEFFPPKTAEGAEKLRGVRAKLAAFNPAYFSVTFVAGGSTQSGTRDTVLEIQREGLIAAPHLSCVGRSRDDLRAVLADEPLITAELSATDLDRLLDPFRVWG